MAMVQTSQQQTHSAATAVSATAGLPTATSHRNSLDELFLASESSMLKPVKQSNSEQPHSASASSGTMRTTRSKAKAKQMDKKSGAVAPKRQSETPAADAHISNG